MSDVLTLISILTLRNSTCQNCIYTVAVFLNFKPTTLPIESSSLPCIKILINKLMIWPAGESQCQVMTTTWPTRWAPKDKAPGLTARWRDLSRASCLSIDSSLVTNTYILKYIIMNCCLHLKHALIYLNISSWTVVCILNTHLYT